ncbi:MAG: trehalose-phosphatase [Actinotalea sp.]|nr:trehalose-phosphatase [Actinotalea sp.]
MSSGLDEALRAFASAASDGHGALLALDFDGVLAPLQDDPAQSRALPAAVGALARLGRVPGLQLALVSGRGIEDLAALAEVPDGTFLVGSHGAERGRWTTAGLERIDLALDDDAAARHLSLDTALRAAVDGTTASVETKPASVVLHTRTASAADRERLTALALELGERPGVDAMHGKEVVELGVLEVTKGDALAALRDELGVDALLYAGDDVTDERAFATLRPDDVTVRVGPGETLARFRVEGPPELAALLGTLADALART